MVHRAHAVVVRPKNAPVSLETIHVPDPGPGEALVDILTCGVCHTDLHYQQGAGGRPETFAQAFYARDLAGTVVLVGVPSPDMVIELPLLDVFGRGGAIKSSWYGDCLPSRDFPMLVSHYKAGNLDLDAFVSERIGLGDIEGAFGKMHRGEVLRSVVEIADGGRADLETVAGLS